MRRLILAFAMCAAAACGGKSKPAATTTDDTGGGGGDDTEDSGPSLADVSPELDTLNTEVGSIRDLPIEERDEEACEGVKGLQREVEDLEGATPAGVDEATWNDAIDAMSKSLDGVKKACPDNADALDAAFTQMLDALDGLVETTQSTATGPAA